MNCLICNTEMPDYIPFCQSCTPYYGQNVIAGVQSIFVGEISFLKVLQQKLRGYKIIRWWVGTDVLLLHKFPPGRGKLSVFLHRIKARLFDLLIDQHWIDGYKLLDEFKTMRPHLNSTLRLWTGRHGKYKKRRHLGLNIAYYDPLPDTFSRWKYGVDLIEKLIVLFPQVNWIKLDGSFDMEETYPFLDGYIRPARHDGWPRIVVECKVNDIPVYWNEDYKPNLEDMSIFVKNLIAAKDL